MKLPKGRIKLPKTTSTSERTKRQQKDHTGFVHLARSFSDTPVHHRCCSYGRGSAARGRQKPQAHCGQYVRASPVGAAAIPGRFAGSMQTHQKIQPIAKQADTEQASKRPERR